MKAAKKQIKNTPTKATLKKSGGIADAILNWYKVQTDDTKLAICLMMEMTENFEGRDMLNEILGECKKTAIEKASKFAFECKMGDTFAWGIYAGLKGL